MKTHIALTLAALAALVTPTAADTPTAIAADYRSKAAAALEKVNDTLEKATVPIIADLVKAGDTAGADEVKTQLKAKQDGEPVTKPHAKAANLFTLYDAARRRALDPIQGATIRKLEAVLAGADGKKLEIVDAVKVVRAEVEAGKAVTAPPVIPRKWTYHGKPDSVAKIAEALFNADGTMEFHDSGIITRGTWKPNRKGDKITIQIFGTQWDMVLIDDKLATLDRPDVGRRYLKLAESQ